MEAPIVNVQELPVGSDLDADAAAGAEQVKPTDMEAFDFQGGTGLIGDPDGVHESITYEPIAADDAGQVIDTVLNLTAPLANAYTVDEGDKVLVTQGGVVLTVRKAYLKTALQEEPLEAVLPIEIWDRLRLGTREVEVAELAVCDYNEMGELEVQSIDARAPAQTGEFILPDTLPYQADGEPPPASPDAVVVGGPKFLGVTWEPVANPDPVNYEVHLSTVSGFVPDATTQVGLVWEGAAFVIAAKADGSPLDFGVTYYVRIVATDIDGAAGPGAEDSGQLVAVPSDETTSDGSVPASSPTPTLNGGPTFIGAKWTPIANPDPVVYEVHVSTVNGFAPDATTKYGETAAGSMVIKTTPAGAALLYGVTYYVKLRSKDPDGLGPVGAQASAQMQQVGPGDISVTNLAAINANLGTVTAGTIDAALVTITHLNATNITTGTLDASVVNVTNINAANISTGNISSARMQTNVLTALQVNVATLSAIRADLGTVTAGTFKTASGVTWAGSAAGVIISSVGDGVGNFGVRAFDGAGGTYELVGSTGKVVVGALASEATRQRMEFTRSGMSMFGGATRELSPPSGADLAWSTLAIPPIGYQQRQITAVTNASTPTITTDINHGLSAGDLVEIRGATTSGVSINGYWTVNTAPTVTTFTIVLGGASGAYTAGTGRMQKPTRIQGQLTSDTNTGNARMWLDQQGLHSQYQANGVNGNAPFRSFDFDPADARGMRMHTATTLDAVNVSPITGVSFLLAQPGDPLGDRAARWTRSDGAVAAKVWGDYNTAELNDGQLNAYAYAKTSSGGLAQAFLYSVSVNNAANYYARAASFTNVFGFSGVNVRGAQNAHDTGGWTLIQVDDAGTVSSDFVRGALVAGTGISITTPALNPTVAINTALVPQLTAINAFTTRQRMAPNTDTPGLDVLRGTDVGPSSAIQRWRNAADSVNLATITAFGRGTFTGGITTLVNAGAISDVTFSETPASGTIAVDTTNSRLYVRVGATWKSVVVA